MVLNVFKTTSEHSYFSSDVFSLNILNTNFIKCSADIGGGFHSESSSNHYLSYCYFYQCSANSEHGWGVVFLIRNGKTYARNCCASGCYSGLGADMMSYDAQQYENIISYSSRNSVHSLWVTCRDNSFMRNINVTDASIKHSNYGNGLNIYISLDNLQLKYVNLNKNKGNDGVLSLEGPINKHCYLFYINIINNTDQTSLIVFNNKAKSSIADAYFCNFFGNQGNLYYKNCNSEDDNFVNFYYCSFDFSNTGNDEIVLSSCSFNVNKIINEVETMICEYKFYYSCKILKIRKMNNLNNILLSIFLQS